MAVRRGASVPAGGNPFWSERATQELRLRMNRPLELPPDGELHPVPGDDEEIRRQLEQEDSGLEAVENGSETESRGEPRQGRGRRRSRSRNETQLAGMSFTTPESWADQGAVQRGFLRTAGMMPAEGEGERQPSRQVPSRTEGLAFSAGQDRDDDLQREVEKEVVRVLQEENEQLKLQVKEMMKKMGDKSGPPSGWSEVSTSSPRQKRGELRQKEELRFTPNGTQVPLGPPPGDQPPVPPWPFPEWEIYEKEEGGRSRRMELNSMEWELHHGPPGGGKVSRGAVRGGGIESRHGDRGDLKDHGRGTGSRQEVRHQEAEGSLGDPQVDRERWLMRELVQLQQALDSEKRSKVRWRVDEDGHRRQVPLGRAEHQGHLGQVPLSRADHPGHQEQVPLSRASHLGYQEGDRAKQWQQGEWGEKGQEGVGSGGAGRH